MKKPTRDAQDAEQELPESYKNQAIKTFENMLRNGVNLVNVPETLMQFKGFSLKLMDDEYFIVKNGNFYKWNDVRKLNINFGQMHKTLEVDTPWNPNIYYDALSISPDKYYVVENADAILIYVLQQQDIEVIRRLILYLNYNSEIELYHISRTGEGVDYSVSVEDTAVNYILSLICVLYPAAMVKQNTKYVVKDGPLMWFLIANIKKFLPRNTQSFWAKPINEPRKLWDHQNEAIDKLVLDRNNGKKTKIIWIPPGLGKTAIVVNYIAKCIYDGVMPKYCVYTLPPSALATVIREFNIRKLQYNHIDMRSTNKGDKNLVPGAINIIYHDHLRMASDLKNYITDALFIVDEFHKTLNATKRTSVTLELANLATDVIAMTGTLVKDTHLEPVIKWLEQSVDFEVTTKNYWVALSSIISRKIQTKIYIERVSWEAPFTIEESAKYKSFVPKSLGGTANNINFRSAVNLSYDAISRELIRLTLTHLKSGFGVFLVARNIEHQQQLRNTLYSKGVNNIFLVGTGSSISLTPHDPPPGVPVPDVVITTPQHSEGYNLTRYVIMISGVYFTNQATRDQLEARINRIDSISPKIRIVLVHAGIISYINRNYEKARSLSIALKSFAKDVNISDSDVSNI